MDLTYFTVVLRLYPYLLIAFFPLAGMIILGILWILYTLLPRCCKDYLRRLVKSEENGVTRKRKIEEYLKKNSKSPDTLSDEIKNSCCAICYNPMSHQNEKVIQLTCSD